MAELAEVKKDQKYSLLGATYLFTPVAIETSGAIGPRSRVFLELVKVENPERPATYCNGSQWLCSVGMLQYS